MRRKLAIFMLVFLVGAGGLLLHGCLASNAERSKVRAQYERMVGALSAKDTNAFTLCFAPAYRAPAQEHFDRLTTFARPLGSRSGISIRGSRAEVCPERLYPMVPLGNWGHTIVMIKVDGEWYFTGKIFVW